MSLDMVVFAFAMPFAALMGLIIPCLLVVWVINKIS